MSLPIELIYEIGIRIPYAELRSFAQVFPGIIRDHLFWQNKAQYDFGTTTALFRITGLADSSDPSCESWKPSPRIRYLEILSEHDCAYGSEEVIDIDKAICNAVRKNDLKLVQYLFPKLLDQLKTMTNPTERGAWTDLTMQIMIKIPSSQGNLPMIQFLVEIFRPHVPSDSLHSILKEVIVDASRHNHRDMLNYLRSFGILATEPSLNEGLYGAAMGHQIELIDEFRQELTRLGEPVSIRNILIGAAHGGHLDLVNSIIQKNGLSELDGAFMDALRGVK
jgi:hypothetical protein